MNTRIATGAGLGFCFGLAMMFLGFLAAAAGHGCYVTIGLASAPLGFLSSLLGNAFVAFIGAPFLWAALGAAAAAAPGPAWGRGFILGQAALGALTVFLGLGGEFADWRYFARTAGVGGIGLLAYAGGLAAAWMILPRFHGQQGQN